MPRQGKSIHNKPKEKLFILNIVEIKIKHCVMSLYETRKQKKQTGNYVKSIKSKNLNLSAFI